MIRFCVHTAPLVQSRDRCPALGEVPWHKAQHPSCRAGQDSWPEGWRSEEVCFATVEGSPPPLGPTRATTWPGSILSVRPVKTCTVGRLGYAKQTSCSCRAPLTTAGAREPPDDICTAAHRSPGDAAPASQATTGMCAAAQRAPTVRCTGGHNHGDQARGAGRQAWRTSGWRCIKATTLSAAPAGHHLHVISSQPHTE